MVLLTSKFQNQSFFLLDCTHYSDCPNEGQNYECLDDLCTCAPGHALDGDACVGMLPNTYLLLYDFKGSFFNFYLLCKQWPVSWKAKIIKFNVIYLRI